MQTSPRRFQLRSRTSHSHATVDAAIGSFDTLESYRRYLRALHAFRASLEANLRATTWPGALEAWQPMLILPFLEADMTDLGVPVPVADACFAVPVDLSGLLGVLYVLEGSSLGARLLYQRAGALGLSDTFGARHLARQAGEIENWRRFLAILEAATPYEEDIAVQASTAAFRIAAAAFTSDRHAE